MSKDKLITFNSEFVKNFFAVRYNIWSVVTSTALLLCIYLYYSNIRQEIIFPKNENFTFEFYTDSVNGGNSVILSHNISDSSIDLNFVLNKGFVSPYTGITITDKADSVFTMNAYNRVHLEISGENVKSIGFDLYANNAYGNSPARDNNVCFYDNIDIAPERKQYDIDLGEMKVTDWWIASNNVPANEKFAPDLKNIYRISIGPANTSASDIKRSLKIYSISFDRDNTSVMVWLLSAEFIIMVLLGGTHYIRTHNALPVTITYKAVDIENENRQINSFLHYINNNFHNPRLTLEHVAEQTGVNQRRIATSIQQTFGCNFKTYVNRLRINESKRLLLNSKLNMGEISFKVGFSNQTHFNRVFKNFEGISPTEFLETKP